MSIERDHKQLPICKKGQPSVAIKIEGPNQPLYGRQLEEKDTLYSMISRKSIDTLKEFYRSDVTMEEWALIKKLKPVFDIPWKSLQRQIANPLKTPWFMLTSMQESYVCNDLLSTFAWGISKNFYEWIA